jgi:Pyruvate/2-oxoacid:ferredoxin oxidoreductase delta subunit
MVIINILLINEEKCDGCGLCIPNCAEGAIQIIEGKAKLVKDQYCDGLGACLGHCPQDAIKIIEREAEAFNEEAVQKHLESMSEKVSEPVPCTAVKELGDAPLTSAASQTSALRQWPVQLNLLPHEASFFKDADLLVMADCVPVSYPNLHGSLLPGRTVVIGCPKLDDGQHYINKLTEIFRRNSLRSITVAIMEVPCCSGLNVIVERALKASGKEIPVRKHIISVKGDLY